MMNIVVCTDHKYIMPCGVLLYSLCKNNSKNKIVFNLIIDESVTENDRENFSNVKKDFQNVELVYYQIDGTIFDNFPNLGNGIYVSKATYYRLYLSEILPRTMNKVLYLDCDMVVRKNILDLWNTNIENVAAAVAPDGMDGLVQLYNRLEYPMEKGYFNAGMMLINLKYWRENGIHERCLNYIKHHYEKIVSHDQDVLNYVLQDSKINVDLTYNFGESFLYKPEVMQFYYAKYKQMIEKTLHDPAIVHFTISKPWKENCMNPFRSLFFKYRNETIWRRTPIEKDKLSWRGWTKKFLCFLKLIKITKVNNFRQLDFEIS